MLLGFLFRNTGAYTVSFGSATFFQRNFPSDQQLQTYSIMYSLNTVIGGVSSCFIGALIGDKFEHKFRKIKGFVAGVGGLIGSVFIAICFLIQPGFWGCIISQFFYILFSEVWYGPVYAMLNRIFPSEAQGFGKLYSSLLTLVASASCHLLGALGGSLMTLVVGILNENYDIVDYPPRSGYIIGSALIFCYAGCAPFFIIASYYYVPIIDKLDKEKLIRSQSKAEYH